MSAMWAENLMK